MPGRAASYKGLGAAFAGVKFLSTASTAISLTVDDQAYLLLVGGEGWTSAARIALPTPEAGMRFSIYFIGDAVSSPTKITSTGDDQDMYASPDSTGQCVVLASTQEGGAGIHVMGINDNRYVAWDFAGSSGARALTVGST